MITYQPIKLPTHHSMGLETISPYAPECRLAIFRLLSLNFLGLGLGLRLGSTLWLVIGLGVARRSISTAFRVTRPPDERGDSYHFAIE